MVQPDPMLPPIPPPEPIIPEPPPIAITSAARMRMWLAESCMVVACCAISARFAAMSGRPQAAAMCRASSIDIDPTLHWTSP